MSNTKINIELTDEQEVKYQEWMNAIKVIHGSYGRMKWSITNNGIGPEIEVYNNLSKTTLDLTDVDNW